MKRALGAAAAVIALTAAGCGAGTRKARRGADGGYDKDKYCGLLEDAMGAEAPEPPKGKNREGCS